MSTPKTDRYRSARPSLLLLAGCVLLLALVSAQVAFAQSSSELESRADSARQDAKGLQDRVDAEGEELSERQSAAATAADRAAQLAQRVSAGEARLAEIEQELGDSRKDLDRARDDLGRSRRVLSDRLVAIYKSGGQDEVGVLFSSGDFSELSAGAEYLQRIKEADDALIERTRDRKSEFERQVEQTEDSRDEQRSLTAELAEAAAEADSLQQEAEQRAAAIAAARSASQARLSDLRGKIDGLDKRAAKARKAEALAAADSANSGSSPALYPPPGGKWAIPEYIVMCESGGNWRALNPISGAGGAYQIIPSTWRLYGGKGLPHEASPAEQSRIAAMIWRDSGPSAWECA